MARDTVFASSTTPNIVADKYLDGDPKYLGVPLFNAADGILYIGGGEDYPTRRFSCDAIRKEDFLPLTGGTLTGVLKSTYESGTWINGVSNAALTLDHKGYGAIFSAPMKDGRVCLSTYPASGNILYFGYANNAQIKAKTNGFNTRMEWDAVNNRLTATTFKGALEGNAASATKLQTAHTINGTSFDGSADITTSLWGSARNIGIVNSDGTGTAVTTSVNGNADINLRLPSTIKADLDGKATSCGTADTANSVAWANVTNKPSSYYTLTKAAVEAVLTGTITSHTHTKAQITDFPTSLPASDVYAWAKASTKPTYNLSEINNKPKLWGNQLSDGTAINGDIALKQGGNINASGGELKIGNSGNNSFVTLLEDMRGSGGNWKITKDGHAKFAHITFDENNDSEIYVDSNSGKLWFAALNGFYFGTDAEIDGLLIVRDDVTLDMDLNVSGDTTLSNVTMGAATAASLTCNGAMTVNGTSAFIGELKCNSNIYTKTGVRIDTASTPNFTLCLGDNSWEAEFAVDPNSKDTRLITKSGDIILRPKRDSGNVRVTGVLHAKALELKHPTPYIDFHFGESTADYTSRIIETQSGNLRMIATVRVTNGLSSDTYVTALSDMRHKDFLSDFIISTEDIANAPSMEFAWKRDGSKALGSSAQYWQKVAPLAIHEVDSHLTMQYDVLALLSSISNAKTLLNHEERIKALEEENRELRHELNRLTE